MSVELTEEEWAGLVSYLHGAQEYAELLSKAALRKAPPATRGSDAQEKLPDLVYKTLVEMGGSAEEDLLVSTVKAILPLERTPQGRDIRRQKVWDAIYRSLVPQGRVSLDGQKITANAPQA